MELAWGWGENEENSLDGVKMRGTLWCWGEVGLKMRGIVWSLCEVG